MSACGFVFDVVDQPHESLLMGWKPSEVSLCPKTAKASISTGSG